ncbi:hypothetical protein E0E50_18595 [Azotobacter chroococcum subsp. isscasi]|uniref:hypothetical protein n=1 Tax=Azotobacter chroococcum TaxID=353 RepID=UPI001038EB1E|nr:hypothetical protein [Azotobacter chroococcum]TBW06788.1 hypothetical protein E0E50_18595 [Azotobacter chroococcum subsp. isscasi]
MAGERESSSVSVAQYWVVVVGALLGALTLVFLMALVIMAALDYEVPVGSRFLVISVLALGAGLASAFLGGTAAAAGRIPVPFASSHPIEFSAAGGVGVLVLIMVLGSVLYGPSSDSGKSLPTGRVVLFDGWARPSESGFSFGSQTIVSWWSGQADVLVANTTPPESSAKLFVQYQVPPYEMSPQDQGARGGAVQMSQARLDDVVECPAEGYGGHWLDTRQNAIYCLRTRDGQHYAKIKVSEVFADRIAFDWIFQPNGSRKFK